MCIVPEKAKCCDFLLLPEAVSAMHAPRMEQNSRATAWQNPFEELINREHPQLLLA